MIKKNEIVFYVSEKDKDGKYFMLKKVIDLRKYKNSLKDCLHCGGVSTITQNVTTDQSSYDVYSVVCGNCGIRTGYVTQGCSNNAIQEVCTIWNNRVKK